jgi:DNA-binding PadR family transcriptional regulator
MGFHSITGEFERTANAERTGAERTMDAERNMEARDFIELAALGTTVRSPANLADIRATLDDVVGHLWSPVGEVVLGCVEDLVRKGLLKARTGDSSGQPVFVPTEGGRQHLGRLLSRPTDCPICPLGQVALKLKLAFIDLAPAAERRRNLEHIVCVYEREVAGWTRRCGACPRQGPLGRMWLDIETDRLQRELAALRHMASGQALASLQ